MYHSESESSESESSGRATAGLFNLLMTRGLTVASLLSFIAGGGSGSSSTDEDGVKGRVALSESGLEGGDEDNKGEDLRDWEGDEGVGKGGRGLLNNFGGEASSEISSRAVCSSLGILLRARRRCALVVGVGALKSIEPSSSLRTILRLPVETLRVLAGMGFLPFS